MPGAVTVDIYFFLVSFPKSPAHRAGGNANTAMSAMTNRKTNKRNARATDLPQVFQSTRNLRSLSGIQ